MNENGFAVDWEIPRIRKALSFLSFGSLTTGSASCFFFFSDPLGIALLELNSFKGICGLWCEEPPKCLKQTICYLYLGGISRLVDLIVFCVFGRI